jgi:hypothetical protein
MYGMRISFLLALLCWQNLVQTSAHEAVEGTLLDYGQPMRTCALSHECDIAQSHALRMRVPLYVTDQRILYDLKEGTFLVSRNPVTFFNQIFA